MTIKLLRRLREQASREVRKAVLLRGPAGYPKSNLCSISRSLRQLSAYERAQVIAEILSSKALLELIPPGKRAVHLVAWRSRNHFDVRRGLVAEEASPDSKTQDADKTLRVLGSSPHGDSLSGILRQ